MVIRSKCFSVLGLLLATICFAESKPFLIISHPNSGKFLQGTPATVSILIRNITKRDQIEPVQGTWYKDGEPCSDNLIGDSLPSDESDVLQEPPKVPKDWTIKYDYDVAVYCSLTEPGEYKLEYRIATGDSGSPPAEPLKFTARILQPPQPEKAVYDWLQECYAGLESKSLGPCYKELLANYPRSIYTAWVVFPSLTEAENLSPEIVKKHIADGSYPLGNSIPDAEYGFKDIPEGPLMANWQLGWAKKILKHHPDFPYAEKLQLNIALSNLVVKNQNDGMTILYKLSNNDTKIGRWSREFLALK